MVQVGNHCGRNSHLKRWLLRFQVWFCLALSRNVPQERYIIKKTHIHIALRFWVGSGVLTFLYACSWLIGVKSLQHFSTKNKPNTYLVTNGFTQFFGLDYSDTFYPVAKMAFVRLFVAMTTLKKQSLYQLNMKNVFLMRICRKKFIWSNLLIFLLSGSLLEWSVIFANLY